MALMTASYVARPLDDDLTVVPSSRPGGARPRYGRPPQMVAIAQRLKRERDAARNEREVSQRVYDIWLSELWPDDGEKPSTK